MGLPETIRAFVAIPLPAEILAGITDIRRQLKSVCCGDSVRWVAPDYIHLTLRFLGLMPIASLPELESALRRACSTAGPFQLLPDGIGAFPTLNRPRVLWLGLSGDLEDLGTLQHLVLRETVGWGTHKDRKFHPHLTLARIKDARAAGVREVVEKVRSVVKPRFAPWRVEAVHLMQSELAPSGARHSELATIPLAQAG